MLLFLAFACTPDMQDSDAPADDSAGPDDSGATDTDTDTGTAGDIAGPDLPACTPRAGSGDNVALSGVILAPDGPLAGTLVYSRSTGTISCVGADCDTTGAEVICTEGVVSPGLIDAHNHLQYNTLPPWQVGPEFDDRYEWRSDDRYWDYRVAYDDIYEAYSCEVMKWAEARELVWGTTSAVGSSGDSECIHVLIRNLDEGATSSGLSSYNIDYSASTVTDAVDAGDGASTTADLASGALDAALYHVAEGRDGSVRGEIDHMTDVGMVGPGQYYVHGSDASTEQLAQMAVDGTGIIWSPRSNLALYATTTPIEIADRLGVPWAIGTDWTPSGSMAPMDELTCAADWLATRGAPIGDRALWEKTTTDAARAVGADGVIGQLAVGFRADIAVFSWDRHPYRNIIEGAPTDVRLVIVDGQALYGVNELLTPITLDPSWCEELDVCGEARSICVQAGESGLDAQTLAEIEASLEGALAGVAMPSGYEYAGELFPLFTCTDERDSCDLSVPTASDADGDGVDDGSDGCPAAYDPLQWDTDSDGAGDVCDECPLTAETECESSGSDLDADGVENDADNCPNLGNADQADADSDGIGDLCDACPEEPNSDGGGCTTTVDAVRDPSHPDHPSEGTVVALSGLVVTGVRTGAGFFAQDFGVTEYGGIYVYDFGESAVAVGDIVDVSGAYTEYYGLTELTDATAFVTGTAPAPDPLEVSPCDIATDGVTAEAYESMLLRIRDTTVTLVNPDDPSDYDEFEVGGCLRIDDFLYDALDQPALGTAYAQITGLLSYGYDNTKLGPRDGTDLEE